MTSNVYLRHSLLGVLSFWSCKFSELGGKLDSFKGTAGAGAFLRPQLSLDAVILPIGYA